MSMNRIFLMVLCCTLFFAGLYAQPIADPKLIEQRVHAELDAWHQDPAQLSFVARHFPEVRGTVVADITLSGKGRIETFFLSETDIKEPRFLEYLQKQVKKHKLKTVLHKGARQKVRHRFVWN